MPFCVIWWPLLPCPCTFNSLRFIALIGGKRYLMNDIHTWLKRRTFKPVMLTQLLSVKWETASGVAKWSLMGGLSTFKHNGCFFHIKCHHENGWNHPVGVTFGCSCYTVKQKMDGLTKAGLTIRFRWEHKWAAKKRNRWGAHGFSQDQTVQALIPRDVFWQQVSALCLYYKAAPDEKIHWSPTWGW